MMKTIEKLPKHRRILLGSLTVAVGALVTIGILISFNPRGPDFSLVAQIVVLGVILSLIPFVVARLIFKTETAKTLAGFLGSVILLIGGAFLGELVFGDVDNLIPWIPIVLFLGAIITSPLIVGSWLGTKIMFASEKTATESTSQTNP